MVPNTKALGGASGAGAVPGPPASALRGLQQEHAGGGVARAGAHVQIQHEADPQRGAPQVDLLQADAHEADDSDDNYKALTFRIPLDTFITIFRDTGE